MESLLLARDQIAPGAALSDQSALTALFEEPLPRLKANITLHPPSTAALVRPYDGDLAIADKRFVETREQILPMSFGRPRAPGQSHRDRPQTSTARNGTIELKPQWKT